jgi:molybdate transport system substrate-binding protein
VISVLSGGAVKSLVQPLAASFRGDTVKLEFQPMGKLVKTLAEGYQADVVIVTREVLAKLQLEGKPIARVGIGVAVHESAPIPDLSSTDAFRRALLAAKSVIYMDPAIGTSGKHVAGVLHRLGIAEQVNAKAKLGQGGHITEAVGRGEIELGIHHISEILPVKGIKLAGPLPPELQTHTVYLAVPTVSSGKVATVKAFIAHLTGAQARERLAQAGYTSPA